MGFPSSWAPFERIWTSTPPKKAEIQWESEFPGLAAGKLQCRAVLKKTGFGKNHASTFCPSPVWFHAARYGVVIWLASPRSGRARRALLGGGRAPRRGARSLRRGLHRVSPSRHHTYCSGAREGSAKICYLVLGYPPTLPPQIWGDHPPHHIRI